MPTAKPLPAILTTTIKIFILSVLFVSCGLLTDKGTPSIKKIDSSEKLSLVTIPDSSTIPDKTSDEWVTVSVDTAELKAFWTSVIVPILAKDKKTVLSNMDFPIYGDWTAMMQLKKTPNEATKDDFDKVYNKFFNSDFFKLIKTQTCKDIGVGKYHDTIWYSISLNRSYGEYEGGLMLMYFKQNGQYKLKAVHGAGANFYDMEN